MQHVDNLLANITNCNFLKNELKDINHLKTIDVWFKYKING